MYLWNKRKGDVVMKKKLKIKNMVILIIITIFLIEFVNQVGVISRLKKEKVASDLILQESKEEKERLEEEVEQAKSKEYIERLAREKLNMIKDGEKTVITEK